VKKVWIWLKHYWYWPIILVLLVFSIASGSSSKRKLFGVLNKQKENYEKELEIVKETTKERDEKKTQIFEGHSEEVYKIEQEHNIKIKELEVKKQQELAQIIKNNKDEPVKLAEDIAKVLSAEYLKNR
jgi:hypothetical protein